MAMRIKRLRISNFERLELGSFNVLIGAKASGKSKRVFYLFG
jgi:predicted ATPase